MLRNQRAIFLSIFGIGSKLIWKICSYIFWLKSWCRIVQIKSSRDLGYFNQLKDLVTFILENIIIERSNLINKTNNWKIRPKQKSWYERQDLPCKSQLYWRKGKKIFTDGYNCPQKKLLIFLSGQKFIVWTNILSLLQIILKIKSRKRFTLNE